MIYLEALVASNLWWEERKTKGAHDWVRKSIPLLFQTLESLYNETRKLPVHSQSGVTSKTVTESYTFTLGIFLSAADYATLRSILSLSGDVYGALEPLKDMTSNELQEIEKPIKELYDYSQRFRELRNFFTHLGESTLSIKKVPDPEIIREIEGQTNKSIGRRALYDLKQSIKKESYHWYKTMREGQYEYIHEFKERINEILWLQKFATFLTFFLIHLELI